MPYDIKENPFFYYKQNFNKCYNHESTPAPQTAKEAILLKCISCCSTYSYAYKCNNEQCPIFKFLKTKKWMKRPHTATEVFLKNRINADVNKRWNKNNQ